MIERTFKLYLNSTGSPLCINANQYDHNETWLFELYSETGERYVPSSGAIIGVKSDGHGIANTGTVDSEGRVVIEETEQMTASAGRAIFELSIDDLTHGTANFAVNVERKPLDDGAVMSDTDLSLIQEAIDSASEIEEMLDGETLDEKLLSMVQSETGDWLTDHITNPSNPPIDTSLTVAGAAADAKATGDEITDLKSALYGDTTIRNYEENKNIGSTGELVAEEGTCTSEFIPYTWTGYAAYDCGDNTKITYRVAFYDSNKSIIGGTFRNPSATGGTTYRNINAETQVTSGTPAYVRFSFKSGYVGKVFLNSSTNYWVAEAYSTVGLVDEVGDLTELDTADKTNLVDAINEVNGRIADITLPIKPSDTNFFYTSPNIADPTDFVAGEFVNQTNGVFTPNSSHTRTGFIPVTAGKTYCIVNSADFNAGIRYAFYSSASESTYLSGANANLDDIGNLVTAPTDATYMVMSANTSRFPFMVAESDTKIDYAEYGTAYLLPQYILDEDISDIPVNLPSNIYALVGYELNIYFENIVEDWTQFNFDVSCSKGMQLERGYRITPTDSDVGSYPLSITISTKDDSSRKTISTTLIVSSASAGSGTTKSVIILGDSTTNNGAVIEKLNENFADDVMGVVTLGTRGTAPNNHEGRSGWSFNSYFTVASQAGTDVVNPFFNPTTETFDASYYFANSGVSVPDWFFINLGINDTFGYSSDSALESAITTIKGLCDAMIASLKSAAPNMKIGLCLTIPPNHSQDAFGKAYNCGQTRDRYKRNNVIWVNDLIETYDNRESENLYLIPIYTNLDTVNNMGLETVPVNARNTAVTYESPIANGGVHPVESGYWQIADVYTAFLKANV